MNDHKQCPNCDSYETERVHTEWYSDLIEEVRICDDCPAQFTNNYNLFDSEVDEIVET